MAAQKETLFDSLKKNTIVQSYTEFRTNRTALRLKFLLFFGTVVLCTVFFSFHISKKPWEMHEYNNEPGNIWPNQSVEADFTFPIYKNDADLAKEKKEAVKKVLPVFTLEKTIPDEATEKLDDAIKKYSQAQAAIGDTLQNYVRTPSRKPADNRRLKPKTIDYYQVKKAIYDFINEAYRKGFSDLPVENLVNKAIIVRAAANLEYVLPVDALIDSASFLKKADIYFASKLPDDARTLADNIISDIRLPNLKFSTFYTKQSEEMALANIPMTEGIVRKGEIIVDKGQKVTPEILKKLSSFERSLFIKGETGFSVWMIVGSMLHASLLISILLLYLFFIRKRIFYDNYQVSILCAILVIAGFLSWLSLEISSVLPVEYFILLPALSMLAAIVFDSRTAFYTTVTMALMVAGIRGNDYSTGVSMMFAGTLAAYTVRDIQSRTQVYKSIFYIFIGYLITILAFSLERSADLVQTAYKLGFALLNSAFSPIITFGLLFILERISNITTVLKLEEFDNVQHPLLMKLSEVAPGTYQHTLTLSVVAEKCAVAISADPLLAKVGALYHDVGKLTKPEYFAENQIDELSNKHDQISPKRSADIIKSHVTEGIRLAKEYHIPQKIADFIPMHHGTSLIKHFYAKALEEANGKPVNQDDFRYPGPKPSFKEAAILMIADSAEALARLHSEREKIESAIERSIQDKLIDGQFDECNLTFREIQLIKDTCIRSLIGYSHQRVEYKEIPGQKYQNDNNIDSEDV
jgi:putative nucleotidyltransferase with HDIG domain